MSRKWLSFPVTLIFDFKTSNLFPLVTFVKLYVSTKLEVSMTFLLRENQRNRTDKWMDRVWHLMQPPLKGCIVMVQTVLRRVFRICDLLIFLFCTHVGIVATVWMCCVADWRLVRQWVGSGWRTRQPTGRWTWPGTRNAGWRYAAGKLQSLVIA